MPTFSQEELYEIQENGICPVCFKKIEEGEEASYDKVIYYNKAAGKLKSRLVLAHRTCVI